MGKFFLDLHLFGDGGGVGAGAGTESAAAATTGAQASEKGIEDDEGDGVVYGKPPEGEPSQKAAAQPDPKARAAEFEKLIKGDYKAEYDARMQKAITERFKNSKQMEAELSKSRDVLNALGLRYGKDPGDVQGIIAALDEDKTWLAQEALQRGVSEDELLRVRSLERDSAELARMRQRNELADNWNRWSIEGESLKTTFPGFDLETEMRNPETGERFFGLLQKGNSVEDAYFNIHRHDILGGAMQYTAQKIAENTTADIRARGLRPPENGGSGSAPAKVYKSDPSQFDDTDLDRVTRAILAGKKVNL